MTEFREPRPGESIGEHYVIERELGRGGFGVVFQARHRAIGRLVACKVLLTTYAKKDPSAVDRFKREATIAAQLMYPNTVRVFDYGETAEGVFYLIMEFVRGTSLEEIIRTEGAVSPRRAVHILRQLLFALTEAHADGIVHRDIKPENLMIVPLKYDPDFVKVMDFGIAKMVGSNDSITQEGITLGTPRYMPVEQLRGRDLSPATDIYAAGLVLYEMLTGHPYFEGDTPVDIAIGVMTGPSLVVRPELGLPRSLAAIIERACAKEASERYQTAAEVLAALDEARRAEGTFSEQAVPVDRAPAGGGGGDGARNTVVMPGVDDGEDSLGRMRTMAVDSDTGREVHGPTGKARPAPAVDRSARTVAMATLDAPTATAAPTVRGRVVDSTTMVEIQDEPAAIPAVAAPASLATPSLLMIMQVATLALVLVAIVKLFAG